MSMQGLPTQKKNRYFGRRIIQDVFKRLKDFYRQYKPYVRVDLAMYGVLILLIILYFVVSIFLD